MCIQAMQKFSRLQRPVYITETGIADAKDHLRAEWAEAYFKAVRIDCCAGPAVLTGTAVAACMPACLSALQGYLQACMRWKTRLHP